MRAVRASARPASPSSASNYGFAVAATDFPRYGQLYLDGRLPIDRLIDRRLALDDLEDAFDRLRQVDVLRQVVIHSP